MRNSIAKFFILLILSTSAFAADKETIVRDYIKAFNNKNLDAMLSATTDNIRWMSVAGEQLSVEVVGRDKLRDSMSEYFSAIPSSRSEIRSLRVSGTFVHTLEEAYWKDNGEEKSQCSMAVYEIPNSKILNVWYFSSHDCELEIRD